MANYSELLINWLEPCGATAASDFPRLAEQFGGVPRVFGGLHFGTSEQRARRVRS